MLRNIWYYHLKWREMLYLTISWCHGSKKILWIQPVLRHTKKWHFESFWIFEMSLRWVWAILSLRWVWAILRWVWAILSHFEFLRWVWDEFEPFWVWDEFEPFFIILCEFMQCLSPAFSKDKVLNFQSRVIGTIHILMSCWLLACHKRFLVWT